MDIFEEAIEYSPCIFLLNNIEFLSEKDDGQRNHKGFFFIICILFSPLINFLLLDSTFLANIKEALAKKPKDKILIFVATTDDLEKVSSPLQSIFSHQIPISVSFLPFPFPFFIFPFPITFFSSRRLLKKQVVLKFYLRYYKGFH